MRLIITLSIIFFIFLVFLGNSETEISNPFLAYLFFILKTIVKYFPYFLIAFCILFLFLIRLYLSRKHLTLKIISHTIFQIIIIGVVGVFISFIILVFVAFLELNIFSVILNQNPGFLGVKTNTQEIKEAIGANNIPPIIITNDNNSENEVIAIAKATSGTNNFYGNRILDAVPNFFILPVGNNSKLLFLDNTLVVKEIDTRDMQIISPVIGYQIIKNYFSLRNIKPNPKISVMNNDAYNTFRQGDAKKKLTRVDIELNKVDQEIVKLNEEIEEENESIEQNETAQREILIQRDKEYNACLSEGRYEAKIFIQKNTEEFCREIITEWEDNYIDAVNEGKQLSKGLGDKQKKLGEYKFFNDYFNAQKKIINISAGNIPSELGIFEPPGTIRIITNNASGTAIADYFNTLSHEYLHYTSYTPDKRLNGSFFEEALTEYFAKQAIKSSLHTETNQGYPVLVKIIEELSKKISEPDLTEIYFNKDQTGLENKLDLVYGENFYKDNVVLFESLLYAADTNQALQIANSIMRKIGGTPLEKKDLLSKESKI